MATQLGLYNAALTEVGDRALVSLDENREPRRVLDTVYADTVRDCLEQGQWNFALRSVRLDADGDVTPAFGFAHIFDKPDDWVRTVGLSASETFAPPLARYHDEAGVWAADMTPIFARYVSSGGAYGLDLNAWPRSFARLVELTLAFRVCERLAHSGGLAQRLARDAGDALRIALNRDAMNEAPPRLRPPGAWTRARAG